jgi:exopolysaccharide/PEP-CTERM locus tyrosine autokinase
MGKFFDALKKAETSRGSSVAEQDIKRIEQIPPARIEKLRLDTESSSGAPAKHSLPERREIDPHLVCLLEPRSPAAERFKMLRAKIFCEEQVCRGRTILVTSAQPLDGKSFIAANLAVSIAQGLNDYALLVDCDLRQPSLHTMFGFKSLRGLSEYLQETTSLEPILQKMSLRKLTLLPAGKIPPNPAELMSSEKMRHLIGELKDRYPDRYIIMDTPPATIAAETSSLSTMVDGVLLVVRSDKSQRQAIEHAVSTMAPEKIVGIVLNCSDQMHKRYNKYYDRYYGTAKK